MTCIPDNVMDEWMAANLTGREWRVVMAVAREVRDKQKALSHTALAKATGIGRTHLPGILQSLSEKINFKSALVGGFRVHSFPSWGALPSTGTPVTMDGNTTLDSSQERVLPGMGTPPSPPVQSLGIEGLSKDFKDFKTLKPKKEKTSKKKESRPTDYLSLFPEEFQRSGRFRDAWLEWQTHRRQKRNALTPIAAKKQAKKLIGWGVPRAIGALENSMERGYVGVFESNTSDPIKRPQLAL